MRHKFLVLTVKKWLKLVYLCGHYRKIQTVFWTSEFSEAGLLFCIVFVNKYDYSVLYFNMCCKFY